MTYNNEVLEIQDETVRTIVRSVDDEIRLSKTIKPGNRIIFRAAVHRRGSISGHKGYYKQIIDKVDKVYPYFVRTKKGYCVQYQDICSYGN